LGQEETLHLEVASFGQAPQLFDEPLADDLINRRFDKRGTDRLALPVAFSEVRNVEARTPSISSMPP
jgi:hypothetical protein